MRIMFDYECEKCGFTTERDMNDAPTKCDICGGRMIKLFPTTVAIHIPSDFSTK